MNKNNLHTRCGRSTSKLLVRRDGSPELLVLLEARHVVRHEHELGVDAAATVRPG
jgi:hypothetical protein